MSEENCVEKKFPASIDAIEQVAMLLEERMEQADVPMMEAARIQLAVEEAVTNVVNHGYKGRECGEVSVRVENHGRDIRITIRDQGHPFDPTSIPPADVTADLEHRRIGGLGVHLIRSVMDSVSYSRIGDENRLILEKKIP